MEAEKAQELLNLPPRIAYAMVIKDGQGENGIAKHKIRTLELAPERSQFREIQRYIRETTLRIGYVRERRAVEEDMRRRQTEWQVGDLNRVSSPPKRRRRTPSKDGTSTPPPAWG
jgi:hypothetical protein